jgi:hypothetical protein
LNKKIFRRSNTLCFAHVSCDEHLESYLSKAKEKLSKGKVDAMINMFKGELEDVTRF